MNKAFVNKADISQWIDWIVKAVQASGKRYNHVVGIREGGVHVSKFIAQDLGLPHYTVRISYYDANEVVEDDGYEYKPGGLVVDDLIDSGKTIETFFKVFGPQDVAVLLWHKCAVKPTYYAVEKPEQWIVFPWEVE